MFIGLICIVQALFPWTLIKIGVTVNILGII